MRTYLDVTLQNIGAWSPLDTYTVLEEIYLERMDMYACQKGSKYRMKYICRKEIYLSKSLHRNTHM